jgi:hypothetical protein
MSDHTVQQTWPLPFFFYVSTALVGLGHFFSFLILYTVGRNPSMGDQPIARPLPTHKTTNRINSQTSIPRVGFEPTIRANEDILCLRPRGNCDRLRGHYYYYYYYIIIDGLLLKEILLLALCTVWMWAVVPTFRRCNLPPSSGSE